MVNGAIKPFTSAYTWEKKTPGWKLGNLLSFEPALFFHHGLQLLREGEHWALNNTGTQSFILLLVELKI